MANNTVFSNAVIADKATELLTTKVNARSLMTIDTSLTETAGMKKTINTYTYSGEAEALGVGVGSTTSKRGSISYVGRDYTVLALQQAFDYYDEDAMKDDKIVGYMSDGATQVMANKMTADFYTALATTDGASSNPKELVGKTEFAHNSTISYSAIADAIADMNVEDESELFLIISPEWKAAIRKDADYKNAQMGEVVYNGQVGTICGIPVIVSKALKTKNCAYLLTKEAITCFLKQDVEVEQDRDADTRKNSVYLRTYYVVALTDATKARKIVEAAS